MKDDYEDTRALNELVEEVSKRKEEFTDTIEIVDNTNNNESSEEVYNNLVGTDEDTKVLDNIKDIINEDSNKDEEEKEEVKDTKKDKKKKKESLIDKFKKLSKKKKIIVISCLVLILLLIITLIVVLVLFKKDTKGNEQKENDIIILKDNYIYENGKLVFIDDNENRLGEYECTNKDENKCYVAYLNNGEDPFEVSINKYENGDIIKQRVGIYLNQYAFVVDQDNVELVTLYDFKNNKSIGDYTGVKAYNDDNLVVLTNKNGEYGLFELKDDGLSTKLDYKYSYIGINKKDTKYLVYKNNKGYYVADYSGKARSKAIKYEIIDYGEEYIVARNESVYYLYDYEGEEFLSNYSYIRLIDKDKVAVVKDNNVYIRSANDSKYNEEGYPLNNNSYVEVNTYDNNKKKVSSEVAFTTAINNDILSLVIDKDTFLINLIEGTISMKYDYYSYFNGNLYFYSDEAKTTLIGTYTCNNKNEVQGEAFVNCYVAKDSVFNDTYVNPYKERHATVPLYNNRYVFIYDSPTLVNDTNREIKLYDFEKKKVIGTYSDVDSGTPSNDYQLKLIATNDTDIIVKKNKVDKYGVIKINSGEAEVIYKTTYDYIERYGSYYLMKTDNTWSIGYDNGSSYSFDGKIMNNTNDYVVVKTSNGVKLYTNEQNPNIVNNTAYKYILLANKVYGVVDNNNKLWVIKYDNNEVLNKEGIVLKTSEYYGVDNPAFKIQVTGNDVRVKVFDRTNYDEGVLFSLTKGVDNNESQEQE